MKAIQLLTIISLLLLVIACVPPAEELANITNETEENAKLEPVVEVKQEITVIPDVHENITAPVIENKTNTTNTTNKTNAITSAAQVQPPQIAGNTIVYTGGAIEMGEGESAKIIIQ